MHSSFRFCALACLLLICGCAAVPPPDPPNLARDLAVQLEQYKVQEDFWPDGYCVHMPGRLAGWVFATRKASFEVTSPEIAGMFVEFGLLVQGNPPASIKAGHNGEEGTWYKLTDMARSFTSADRGSDPRKDKLNSLCFGQGSDLHVTLIEPPENEYRELWQRVVRYEFAISGMPAFTQTTRFKTFFHGVPNAGVNKALHVFTWVPGHRWQEPFTIIRPEAFE